VLRQHEQHLQRAVGELERRRVGSAEEVAEDLPRQVEHESCRGADRSEEAERLLGRRRATHVVLQHSRHHAPRDARLAPEHGHGKRLRRRRREVAEHLCRHAHQQRRHRLHVQRVRGVGELAPDQKSQQRLDEPSAERRLRGARTV